MCRQCEIVWTSDNEKWQLIRHTTPAAGSALFNHNIGTYLRNERTGQYEEVTPFDIWIPAYVSREWSRQTMAPKRLPSRTRPDTTPAPRQTVTPT